MEKNVEKKESNVGKKESNMSREITEKMLTKSEVREEHLKDERIFIPTLVSIVKNKNGRYRIMFSLGKYEIKSENGLTISRDIMNDPEFMQESDVMNLIVSLGVTAEKMNNFKCRGYLRLIRVKGSKVDESGITRNYDFWQYELFIKTKLVGFNGSNIFYHRNINTMTRKTQSLSYSTANSFYTMTNLPYYLRENIDEIENEEYGN